MTAVIEGKEGKNLGMNPFMSQQWCSRRKQTREKNDQSFHLVMNRRFRKLVSAACISFASLVISRAARARLENPRCSLRLLVGILSYLFILPPVTFIYGSKKAIQEHDIITLTLCDRYKRDDKCLPFVLQTSLKLIFH